MNIDFHRLPAGYRSQAVRDDGVTVRVPGFDRKHEVPHDLAHFAAEYGFGEARGFWGSVAAGAMFGGMEVVAGRRRPHAAERSRAVIRANAERIGNAEALASTVHEAFADGLGAGAATRRLARHWASIHTDPCPYGAADMTRACALLTDLSVRWKAVAPGGILTLDWDLPVEHPATARRTHRHP
ncbi:MAG TPA: hypothetical protein VGL93_13035, partial [Streptosporangiaceae bacterium]